MTGEFKTRVYIADVSPLKDMALFNKLYAVVSETRRNKTDRYRFQKDKMLSLAAEVLLKRALSDLGITEFSLIYGKNGKPYLKNNELFFNLSHTGERAMCAVSPREVGCDAEVIGTADYKIADRFFSAAECEYLRSIDDDAERNTAFYRLWTLKESYAKATGLGIQLGLESFSIGIEGKITLTHDKKDCDYYFKEYDIDKGCRYAVCSKYPFFEDVVRMVDLRD